MRDNDLRQNYKIEFWALDVLENLPKINIKNKYITPSLFREYFDEEESFLHKYKVKGVYFLFDDDYDLVYIGKSKRLFSRIIDHIKSNEKEFTFCSYINIECENERSVIERFLINHFLPVYNTDILTIKEAETNQLFHSLIDSYSKKL